MNIDFRKGKERKSNIFLYNKMNIIFRKVFKNDKY